MESYIFLVLGLQIGGGLNLLIHPGLMFGLILGLIGEQMKMILRTNVEPISQLHSPRFIPFRRSSPWSRYHFIQIRTMSYVWNWTRSIGFNRNKRSVTRSKSDW